MREVFRDIERWERDREEIALATIVGVRGSSPRRPGAHLAVARAGKLAGSLSAGCVENDIVRRALEVLDDGAAVVATFDVAEGGVDLGVGLTCGGAIDVLIERFAGSDAWSAARAAAAGARPAVLAVALEPAALLGRRLAVVGEGARPLADDGGGADDAVEVAGTLDPRLDEHVVREARALLRDGGTRLCRLPLADGEAAVFLEAVLPPARLIVVGATDTAAALARLAKVLDYEVMVVDAREAYAQPERVPDADELLCAWPGEVLGSMRLDARTSVVTLAHDPKLDVPALACALRSKAGYVGALGSRRTHEARKQTLRELGFGEADLARIHAPVGLDLGGKKPEEIALAILAEIVAVKHGRAPQRTSSSAAGHAPFVAGVILAAGAARRMGRPKQLMMLGGRSILQRVVDEALASRLDELVVVLGAHAGEIEGALRFPAGRRVKLVVNESYAEGISSSLRSGLRACDARADAAAILLGDQPGVAPALISRMLDALAETRAPLLRPVFVAPDEAHTPGHPVILAREVWPEAEALAGDEGARALFTRHRARVHEVRVVGAAPMDIDTFGDFRRAEDAYCGGPALRAE